MLNDEYRTASNIKSHVNKLSVLSAITSVKEKLKKYNKVPNNGLVLYCGTMLSETDKEKKISIDFEPYKKINTTLYLCDNKCHVDPLIELTKSYETYGFMIMDGNGCLFATLCGNDIQILYKFNVELPKKHTKGGQSFRRLDRIRLEKRHHYIIKCVELCAQNFIHNNIVIVNGLILAGVADFKNKLYNNNNFDNRLKNLVINIVDIAYGGENGLKQAIELCSNELKNLELISEINSINIFMGEINKNTNKYCYGLTETLNILDMGIIDILLIWDNIKISRIELNDNKIIYVDSAKINTINNIKNSYDLFDWLFENYDKYDIKLKLISDNSSEGKQFINGFGGIGGILKYKLNMENFNNFDEENDNNWI